MTVNMQMESFIQSLIKTTVEEVLRHLPPPSESAGVRKKEYLTSVEVEEIYGLNVHTLACWRSEGQGPRFVKDGRIIRYKASDVDAFMKSRRVRTSDQRD